MGGLVGRYFVTILGGAPWVRNLITIGAPHGGAPLSPFALGFLAKELEENSKTMQLLAQAPAPAGVDVTTIWSRSDGLVSAGRFARMAGAEEVVYDDLGHLTMLASPRVAKEIARRLLRA